MPAFYNAAMQQTLTSSFVSKWFDVAGVRLHALVREGARPLVFVHGLSASSAFFSDAADRPELDGRGLIVVDLPGYGASVAPPGFACTMREQAGVLVSLFESEDLRDVTLVAHSMGGTVAMLAIDSLADRVNRLVLAEAILVFDETIWSERISSGTLDEWRVEFASMCRRPEIYARGSMLRRNKAALARITPCLSQTTAEAMYASAVDLQAEARNPALYQRFLSLRPTPTYMIGELHDTSWFYRRLVSDGARVVIVPGSGHLMMLDNPDVFYAEVAEA